MKERLLVLITLLICIYPVYAQTNSYTVQPDENLAVVLNDSIKFHYQKFSKGNVFFRDGNTSAGLLNYNMLSGEMQFIAPKGDTLALANEATIRFVVIGNDTFYYDKTYLQLVYGNSTAKLAKKESLQVGDIKKIGGYGGVSSTSAISTISTMRINGQSTKLIQQQQITLLKETTYYIGDTYNHFLQANKKNTLKLFGKKQKTLEQYFKNNKVTFNKAQDLKALIDFLQD